MFNEVKYVTTKGDGSGEGWAGMGWDGIGERGVGREEGGERKGREGRGREGRGGQVLLDVAKGNYFWFQVLKLLCRKAG